MSDFVDNLNEVFALFGPIQTRRMFGGYGVYHDSLMFGLVADDVLYLKADDKSSDAFSQLGLSQFEYEKGSKKVKMSYYMAPEEIFDDPNEAREWATRAFDAALRARKPGSKKGSKKK
ncbi:TfoX/Sxy family protein [Solemya velum gill symbiont]|uniref:Transcriptional regulator n=1 Tax=Solemya velum gill symbiont TaxID=2340 RepID=A0A0B0H353_SOVGS|nr:TfoX/Sxy family protein [Solemya velum gill symbiont]KHF24648.1 transcriptional regulator [Solemya velum gill symbiont]OOY34052.1 transcriptional regulator [Solemya velum gill symbiont]OOY36712.1 transcriptional regulator [Solemya velum gill symbiont]OOY40519.1 transcriptional regulator [Solemya velum gill symbiont]OOY41920.1 transcriptional regulator [Solemya velum gill symbiont]